MKIETKKFYFFFIFLALILSLLMGIKRINLENSYKQVDLAMSLSKIRELSTKEGYDESELLRKIKAKGITSIAIQEDTIITLLAQGKIAFFNDNDLNKIKYLNNNELIELGTLADGGMLIACEDSDLFQRMKSTLQTYFGENLIKPNTINGKSYLLISILGAEEELTKLGLGFSRDDISKIQQMGFNLILRPKNSPKISMEILKQKLSIISGYPDVSAIIFDEEEILGYPSSKMLSEVAKYLAEQNLPFGIIEFTSQKGIDAITSNISELAIRVHSITKEEMEKISQNKAIDRWIRAAQERNIRLFYINPFLNTREGSGVESNLAYIENIKKELNKNNFYTGSGSMFPPYQLPLKTIYLIGLGVISAGILLLSEFFNINRLHGLILLVSGLMFMFIFKVAFSKILLMKILALSAAIVFPSLAIIANKDYFINTCTVEKSNLPADNRLSFPLKKIVKKIFIALTRIVLISLSGGILVAALLTHYQFMLAIQLFSGIKVAFILPILLAFWYYWWTIQKNKKNLLEEIKKPILFEHALLLFVIMVFGVIYIMRSGNFSFLSISLLEEKTRLFLEKYLIARPRNKEFLIGYPLISLAIIMNELRIQYLKIPIIVMGAVAPITTVNTFCHIHSPLLFSLLRAFNGYWLGLFVCILLVTTIFLFLRLVRIYFNGKKTQHP